MVIGCSDISEDGRKLIFCSKEVVKESPYAQMARGCRHSNVVRPRQFIVAAPKSQLSAS